MLDFNAHVGTREQRGSEADQGRQRHQKHVERIDEKLFVAGGHRTALNDAHHQCRGSEQGGQADHHIYLGGIPLRADDGEQRGTDQGKTQYQHDLHVNPP